MLKLDKTGTKKLSSNEVRLPDNKSWELDNYEDLLAGSESAEKTPTCGADCHCTEEPETQSTKKNKLHYEHHYQKHFQKP